ncbi:MAG: S-layer family protein [Sodalinema sp.]
MTLFSGFPLSGSRFPVASLSLALLLTAVPRPSLAQITPDQTLPNPSQVIRQGNQLRLQGGTQAEGNLFHSFEQFSIPAGHEAMFENSPEIRRIFSRVTGEFPSRLDGRLSAQGSADLFLLNPNGILFGDNAQLSLGGSFYASTGEFIEFDDGSQFHAAAPSSSILSVNVPVGLGFGSNPAAVVNRSRHQNEQGETIGLSLNPGARLALSGGQVEMPGGRVTVVDGQVTLATLAQGRLSLNLGEGLQSGQVQGRILLTDGALLDTSGPQGGGIWVFGDRLRVENDSQILADTDGGGPGQGIDLTLGDLVVIDNSLISTSSFGPGRSGDLNVVANEITVDGAGDLQSILERLFALEAIETPQQVGIGLYAMAFAQGQAGDINLRANSLRLTNGSFISTTTVAEGQGGIINAEITESLSLDGSQMIAETLGNGNAGGVNLRAGNIFISDGGGIFVSTFRDGEGGTANLQARDTIEIVGTTPNGLFNSGIGSNAFQEATSRAGTINLQAGDVIVRDGGSIGTVTFGTAQAGTIVIRASDRVEVSGVSAEGNNPTNIASRSESRGAAGDIEITTGRFILRDGAEVLTSTSDSGSAGRLTVRASESALISGGVTTTNAEGDVVILRSGLRSNSTLERLPSPIPSSEADVLGAAGDVTVVTPFLRVENGAQLVVSSVGEGERGGNLTLEAARLELDNQGRLVAETASDVGGNIRLLAEDVRLLNESSVSTNALGAATGGNIQIDTATLVALGNSDITANAQQGAGGQVEITAQGVFGTEVRDRLTDESDITASSERGAEFSGLVEIASPDTQLDSSLVELASEFIPVDRLVADSCLTRTTAAGRFTVTGTGGLPETPFDAAAGRYSLLGVVGAESAPAEPSSRVEESGGQVEESWQLGQPIQEAQGVQQTADGRVWLGRPQRRDRPCGPQ